LAATSDPVESQVSCPKPYVSATVSPPPPQRDRQASRTRVRNQRRTTSAVIGFCDRRAHGTAARLRPHLHHRPQPHLQVTPSSAPAGTGVDGARQRRHTDRPMHSARSWTACLRRCRRLGESAGSSLVGLNRLPPELGAVRLRRSAAGRTPAWSRSPSPPPQELRGVVVERCAATATAAGDA
jgi:hypothetical protein